MTSRPSILHAATADEDLARAKRALPSLRLRLDMASPEKRESLRSGLSEVIAAAAETLAVPSADALSAKGLDLQQIQQARNDLERAFAACSHSLGSTSPSERQHAARLSFGCELMLLIYTMRVQALSGPVECRTEARKLADVLGELAVTLLDE